MDHGDDNPNLSFQSCKKKPLTPEYFREYSGVLTFPASPHLDPIRGWFGWPRSFEGGGVLHPTWLLQPMVLPRHLPVHHIRHRRLQRDGREAVPLACPRHLLTVLKGHVHLQPHPVQQLAHVHRGQEATQIFINTYNTIFIYLYLYIYLHVIKHLFVCILHINM